ncbi:MAG TPA: ACP S-malonyltransferase [Egibacteraceae bacterium]|nr:ACP S-malonyltransferase [Egibacteraceae bacterium]
MTGAGAVALVFPGQGSQQPGMALPWREHPAFSRWAEADSVLDRAVTRLGLDADADELREPATCQVALFVHHAVLLAAWRAAGGSEPVAVAGHSLGEYNALLAAGVLGFADALRLVDARARATQEAADAAPGTLVACLGFPVDEVTAACARAGAHVANDNAPGQVVVAGSDEALGRLREELAGSDTRGKVVDLPVGAAYHSPHMAAAVEPLGAALDAATFADAVLPVVANVDAAAHTAAGEWPGLLRDQVVSPVRWRESVATLARLGATAVVELGASPVLTGLVKRTDRGLGRQTVTTPEDLPS